MVDMFLDPVMVGGAGREVRRCPRGCAAGLEPRRITGEGRGGGTESWLGREKREREAAWTGLRALGVRSGGKRRKKQRALLRAPGCPARPPPRAEPTAARELLELRGPRVRALYRELQLLGGRARGRGQNVDPAGVSRQRRPSARGRQAPFWPLIGRRQFFPLGEEAERPRGGAGCRGALGGVESSAQMGAAGWRRVDTAPLFWGCTIGNPQHVLRGRDSASLDVSFPARSC